MSGKLKQSLQIWKLASDLGLHPDDDPVSAVLNVCETRIREVAREFRCTNLSTLLNALATALGTTFVEVHSESDLSDVQAKYLDKGERAFATLSSDLGPDVLAITFRLTKGRPWERPFVSIIDCRGDKAFRPYYSKWHELAHLLTLTDQMRLSFMRTHSQAADMRDPEEALMEVIAGTFGFWDEMLALKNGGRITFDMIDRLRLRLCPDASLQASIIGLVRAWSEPSLLIQAAPGLKEKDKRQANQGHLGFAECAVPELRAVKVTANNAAKEAGLFIYPNMRIPKCSIIAKVFYDDIPEGEAAEDLGNWTTSNGGGLAARPVVIQARRAWEGVMALVTLP